MSKSSGHGVPKASPKRPIPSRLEDVRALFGIPSLKAFWAQLCEGWQEKEAVSYEAVRNYHYNRDAPASYLARVSEVFGVSLKWLVTGEGEVFPRPQEEVFRQILSAYPELKQLTRGQQELVIDLVVELWYQAPDHPNPTESPEEIDRQLLELAGDVTLLLFLPLRWWGFKEPGDARGSIPQTYYTQMLIALATAVLPADYGDRYAARPTRLMAKLQAAVASEPNPTGASQFFMDDLPPAEQQRWAEAIITTRKKYPANQE